MTILVTGANGFIGRHLCTHLTQQGRSVIAMLRRSEQLGALQRFVRENGGEPSLISAIGGNVDCLEASGTSELPALTAIVHLAARFAWGMTTEAARQTNVTGALNVARLAKQQSCRLIMVSGFMIENHQHLKSLGIDVDTPMETDWPAVYRQVGAYEASKLEGALRVRWFCREHLVDMVEVQPATVAGHSRSGDLDSGQPLYALMENIYAGRMAMVPGTAEHWLPLVSVDLLAALIAAACSAVAPPEKLLALDPSTPNLKGLLGALAAQLNRKAPSRHIPIGILKGLLIIPGMQNLMNTSIESLNFIQPTRFNPAATQTFMREENIEAPEINAVIRKTAQQFQQMRQSPVLQTGA